MATLTSVIGGGSRLGTHMLSHYASLGIARHLLHLHESSDDALAELSDQVLAAGASIVTKTVGQWSVHLNTALLNGTRQRDPNEWFVIADHDELQAYPDGLAAAIAFCNRHGYDYIEGCLVDRLAEGGTLPPVEAGVSLWDQYPLGSVLSKVAGGAVTNKVVAAKGGVQLSHGQHHAYSGIGCPPRELYVPVHHFKWNDATLAALRQRRVGQAEYSLECSTVAAYLERHGRVDVDDPALLVARCEPDYPHWNVLREGRIAAEAYSEQMTARRHQMAAAWALSRRQGLAAGRP
jgi:hypothetical protein